MLDFLLGAAAVGLAIQGFRRGAIPEAWGLAIVTVAAVAAIRGSSPIGGFVAGRFDTAVDGTRLITGVVIFSVLWLGALLVHRAWSGPIGGDRPSLGSRLAGATAALGKGTVVAAAVLSVVALAEAPPAVASQIAPSSVASWMVAPDGPVQEAVGNLSGDRVVARGLRLRTMTGSVRIGDPGGRTLDIATPAPPEPTPDRQGGVELLAVINRARVLNDVAPLAAAGNLEAIATAHGMAMYAGGWYGHVDPEGNGPADRLVAANVPHVTQVELLGIGLAERSVVDQWGSDLPSATLLLQQNVTRAGAAVITGPIGRMMVVVFTG